MRGARLYLIASAIVGGLSCSSDSSELPEVGGRVMVDASLDVMLDKQPPSERPQGPPDASIDMDRSDVLEAGDGGSGDASESSPCVLTSCGSSCVDIDTDAAHCGACFHACLAAANAAVRCAQHMCSYSCDTGYADCDGVSQNGCETPVNSDPGNCGSCGHSCMGGQCVGGNCRPALVAAAAWPAYVATDSASIYFSIQGTAENGFNDGAVRRLAILGSAAQTTVVANLANPRALAVDGTNVYWVDASGLGAAPKDQSSPGGVSDAGPLLSWTLETSGGLSLALSPTRVYAGSANVGIVFSTDLRGLDPLTSPLLLLDLTGLVLDGGYLYALSYQAYLSKFTMVDGMPDPNSAVPLVASGFSGNGFAMTKTGDSLYWLAGDSRFPVPSTDGSVMRTPIAGGSTVPVASHQAGPIGIAADAGYVYWTNYYDGTIMRADPQTGEVAVLAEGQDHPLGVMVDAKGIYWANNALSGSVMRLVKDTAPIRPTATDGGVFDADVMVPDVVAETSPEADPLACLGPRFQHCPVPEAPCVDTYTDVVYCGDCSNACGWNKRCLQGVCVYY